MSSYITTTLSGSVQQPAIEVSDDIRPKRQSHELIQEIRSHLYSSMPAHYRTAPPLASRYAVLSSFRGRFHKLFIHPLRNLSTPKELTR